MKMICIPSLMILPLVAVATQPAPKFPIGKETTFFTHPLDNEGFVDFEAALNERAAAGVTPDNNANVLLWKALGPTSPDGENLPAEFFKRLGMDMPLRSGDYFVSLSSFRKRRNLDNRQFIELLDQLDLCGKRPWKGRDFPLFAAFLKTNEKPLTLVAQAVRRPKFFNPLACARNEKEPRTLVEALPFSTYSANRQLASVLTVRALLRVGEGDFDEAWQDLLACHRLGRLVGRSTTLIEAVIGIAIERIASEADLAYIERANLNSRQIADRWDELQRLPPLPPMANIIDVGERCLHLDVLQTIRRHGLGTLERLSELSKLPPPAEKDKASGIHDMRPIENIDWAPVLRDANRWIDRATAAMRLKDRADRQAAIAKIEDDLKKLSNNAMKPASIAKLIPTNGVPDKAAGKAIGDALLCLSEDTDHISLVRTASNAQDYVEQIQRNLRVAFALAAYRSDHGYHPANLDDLAPKYLGSIPNDLFSGKALIYRLSGNGYLLYSVGKNGKDEEGRGFDDNPAGDDLSVRMPLPELKRKS